MLLKQQCILAKYIKNTHTCNSPVNLTLHCEVHSFKQENNKEYGMI